MNTDSRCRDIVVTLRAIKAASGGTDTEILSAPEFVYIDSSIPEMVLPAAACEAFEKAFGIKVDEASGRYLMDEATHNSLKEKNPTINFTLANSKDSQRTIDISLPYAAFDLQIQKPLYNGTANSSAYFPLRRAPEDNPDTYALGRAFLQEAYLTVDYNSRTFNLSQARFPDPLNPRILAVPPNLLQPDPNENSKPGNETTPAGGDPGTKAGLSTGALAGIIVAAVLGSLLLVTLIFFCCPCGFCPALTICGLAGGAARHRKKTAPVEIDGKRIEHEDKGTAYNQQAALPVVGGVGGVHEAPGQDAKVEIGGNPIMHPQEMPAELPPGLVTAAAARQSHEMAAGRPSAELEAGSSSGPNVSSESRGGDNQYLSSGSEGISSVSGNSPTPGTAEVHGTGIRPTNGPADRLGRVDEIVSPVSPTQAQNGWGRGAPARPGNMRINTDEAQVPRVRGEPSTAVSPQTPYRWGDSSTD